MGRKGVSKRKTKSKITKSDASTNGTVSSLARATDYKAPQTIAKGMISINKGGKKKSSD